MSIERIFAEVAQERDFQDHEHGGASHDDRLRPNDWIAVLARHLGLACTDEGAFDEVRYRRQLVRVAAVAVAALESHGRLREHERSEGLAEAGARGASERVGVPAPECERCSLWIEMGEEAEAENLRLRELLERCRQVLGGGPFTRSRFEGDPDNSHALELLAQVENELKEPT